MIPRGVAGPEAENAVPGVAESAVDVVAVVEPEVVFAAAAAEPEVVSVAVASAADIAEPQAFVDIALAFDVLIPASAVAAAVDSSAHSRFFAFPNVDCYASSSSSFEVVG